MSKPLSRTLSIVLPEGVVVVGLIGVMRWEWAYERSAAVLGVLPYAVLVAGVLLALRLEWSRILLALLALALADAGLRGFGPESAAAPLIALLLALNLTADAFLKEYGLVSRVGAARAAFLGSQVAAVVVIAGGPAGGSPLDAHFLPFPVPVFGDVATITWFATLGILGTALVLNPSPVLRGFFWAAVATIPALLSDGRSTAYFAIAGLVLVVAMIETSYSLAYRDGLTGLRARRSLDEALDRLSGTYTVAMVDIDHFKQLNDRHGHDVGDQVLKMVARTIEGVGGGGRAFRYGGEEFAVLFRGKAADECVPYLERLREAVEQSRFLLRGVDRPAKRPKKPKPRKSAQQVGVTVSIGTAGRDGREMAPADVLKAADQALYKAKRGGRNRVKRA